MKIRFIIVTILILNLSAKLAAKDYLWPTDASKYLTSSFAEYRPGHFHAGIDIKTWNKEGYKVFAIQDGYIWRLRMSPFGYGKAVYLKLYSGETIVYGHLQKFNNKIEQIVKKEQKKNGEYRVNKYFSPERIPVKKGDIIAFTGSTGIGSPHLHFEVRDQNNHPMNPFLLSYKIDDTVPPGISGFCITPLNANSRTNSDVMQVITKPVQLKKGEYKIRDPLFLYGDIGCAIDCWDKANGVHNVFAVYRINFYVNGQLKFSSVYNKFSYDVSGLIDLERDYRLNKRGRGLFQKLYKEHGNKLPFYKPLGKNSGILHCDPSAEESTNNGTIYHRGPHNFLVELFDFNGNLTTLRGEFFVAKKKQLFSKIESDEENNFYLTDIFDEDGCSVNNSQLYFSYNSGHSWKKHLPDFEYPLSNNLNNHNLLRIVSPVQIFKIITSDELGNSTFPDFTVVTKKIPTSLPAIDFRIKKDFYDDYVRLELSVNGLLKDMPRLFVQQMGIRPIEIKLIQHDFNKYFGVYQFIPEKDGPVDIEIYAQDLAGKEFIFWDKFDIETISPTKGGEIVSKDGKCQIKFGSNAVFKNLFLRVNNIPSAEDTSKYDIVGLAYDIDPYDVPLKKSATIYLKYPANDSLPEKLGVYCKPKTKSNNKSWNFAGNKLDRESNTIATRISNLTQVTLIRDIDSPEIRLYYPKNNAYIHYKYPTIKASIKDKLSGIADERSIVVKLDGQKVIAEYDPEEKIVKYRVEEPLIPRKHTVSVWAVDNCGNENEVNHTFTVINTKK